MNRFGILELAKDKNNIYCGYVLIKDNQENISFWLEYSLMDGYGNKNNFKTDDLYADWEFNQYIFHLDNEEDVKAQNYQNNAENVEELGYFIDDENALLVSYLKGE
jgi:hypothetical protein